MLFNSYKCEHSGITNKCRLIQTSYTGHGQKLKGPHKPSTLDKLTWNSHTDIVTKRANQTTAFLRRNLPTCTKEVKAKCYKFLVRLQLEIAATIWEPHTKVNATKVAVIQRCAARFCWDDYHQTSSVTSMSQELGWEDLQTRRKQNKAIMMYKIAKNLVEITVDQYLTTAGVSTRGHQQRFVVPFCLINAYKGSFFQQRSISGMPCQQAPYQYHHMRT